MPKSVKANVINLIADYTREFDSNRKEKPILRWIKPNGTYTVIDPNIVNSKPSLT